VGSPIPPPLGTLLPSDSSSENRGCSVLQNRMLWKSFGLKPDTPFVCDTLGKSLLLSTYDSSTVLLEKLRSEFNTVTCKEKALKMSSHSFIHSLKNVCWTPDFPI
jgi:hypothetical protein